MATLLVIIGKVQVGFIGILSKGILPTAITDSVECSDLISNQ